jgi:pyruvate kinase
MPQIPVPASVLSALTPGQEMLLDDGKLLLKVTEISCCGNDLPASCPHDKKRPPVSSASAEVLRGGTLRSRKSIALPGVRVDSPAMTETDRENLRFAKEYGVTAVMQPFVRSPEDLKTVRAALNETGCGDIRLFAKIENTDGIRMIENLIPEADEIVIARGDLGNAIPLWELIGVQKDIAAACRAAGVPFVVVSQMLASMEENPVPTRAEMSDIFNAVLDGASMVMLTGETAAGKHPAEAILYMARTVRCALEYRQK